MERTFNYSNDLEPDFDLVKKIVLKSCLHINETVTKSFEVITPALLPLA